jgi:hypothetical protein
MYSGKIAVPPGGGGIVSIIIIIIIKRVDVHIHQQNWPMCVNYLLYAL